MLTCITILTTLWRIYLAIINIPSAPTLAAACCDRVQTLWLLLHSVLENS